MTPPDARRPCGFWSSLGLAIVGYALIAGVQFAVVALALNRAMPWADSGAGDAVTSLGLALSISVWLAVPVTIGLVALGVALCNGPSFADYIGLKRVGLLQLLGWAGLTIALAMLAGVVDHLIARRPVPDFIVQIYTTAGSLPLLWSAMVVGAPLMEEPLFRGFVLRGWADSRLGPGLAVVLLALLWALVHVQYDVYNMTEVFVLGLLLGWARVRSGSLWPPLAMHGTLNLLGMMGAAYYVG